jgi:L-Ala-D/L-Glu epimerase
MSAHFELWCAKVPLSRPYAIAYETCDSAQMAFVRFSQGKYAGYGCASPLPEVTGESFADCQRALEAAQVDPIAAEGLLARAPAARAALDMAQHDLNAKRAGRSLVDLFGRAHERLETSITIGIKPSVAEALAEADEYRGRGFRFLKIKIGSDLEADLQLLAQLRERCGDGIRLCVDANEGYGPEQLPRLMSSVARWQLEFVEQPLPRGSDAQLTGLDASARQQLALDESLLSPADAERLVQSQSCGIFNIKLMKCGGITPALEIARIAGPAGIALMWGCSDESRISIAAALHTAYACPATRWLDLDGHLDLARDPASAGFTLENGVMQPLPRPGLGIDWEGWE